MQSTASAAAQAQHPAGSSPRSSVLQPAFGADGLGRQVIVLAYCEAVPDVARVPALPAANRRVPSVHSARVQRRNDEKNARGARLEEWWERRAASGVWAAGGSRAEDFVARVGVVPDRAVVPPGPAGRHMHARQGVVLGLTTRARGRGGLGERTCCRTWRWSGSAAWRSCRASPRTTCRHPARSWRWHVLR